jgi:SpoVK/Ycf46/Vps4 family AAA+-type ATPase
LFSSDHFFHKENILDTAKEENFHSPLRTPLRLSKESLNFLTTGKPTRPHFSVHFPARLIRTELSWSDLVLPDNVMEQVAEIENWIEHGDTLLSDWKMAGKIRPGYRTLFHGPPGTGKTLTACLLGKKTGHDVYRVDISTVVSKYIGETEKNLSRIFDLAEHKKWMLFFDEADALFGKRSETKGANDRYANQEVSYLLQRIEAFEGIIILASNYKTNIDAAFARRFESMIYFPKPDRKERLTLWKNGFSPVAKLDESIDLEHIAEQYTLSGGAIMNVIRYASLQALANGDGKITAALIQQGLIEELGKEGRILN